MAAASTALAETQPGREITLGDLFDVVGSLVLRVEKLTEKVDKLHAATARCADQVSILVEQNRKGSHGNSPPSVDPG
jgi:hypothetical protein